MALRAGTPVEHLHLTFGPDPAASMAVSWTTPRMVRRPRVRFGSTPGRLDHEVHAVTRVYTDAVTGEEVINHHALLTGLEPGSRYLYEVIHDRISRTSGGTLRTAPRGRAPFTFTCFGDHGTSESYDPFGTPASRNAVTGVDRVGSLFTLVVGDLSYANQRRNPPRAWSDWFNMIGSSARHHPWMPAAGNHEIERGNGPLGLAAYQSRFLLPGSTVDPDGTGTDDPLTAPLTDLLGLWYAFTVANVRFVVLQNDDVCYQDAGTVYIRGYSGGRQRAWLERTLRQARADPDIDWIIVCMHQTAVSSAAQHNGADLGIREQWLPLFDTFGVDLVLCGHEHHYERTHPLRGVAEGSATLTPQPAPATGSLGSHLDGGGPADGARQRAGGSGSSNGSGDEEPGGGTGSGAGAEVVDTSHGTVHMVLGTGGSSSPSASKLLDPPAGRVIIGVEPRESDPARFRSVHALEPAPWLALRAPDHPYAFAGFEVDPGADAGLTSIRVTVYDHTTSTPLPFDTFTLVRPCAAGAGRAGDTGRGDTAGSPPTPLDDPSTPVCAPQP
ncbi:purple acid phosphatase family protein [Frankia sp. CiP1_Cm_nod1]|uniref:purple acid phosphatase family protein n=1 Tax=Frankia sp. CiP1_Cm_nod1 TaxID=2897160 RepID=UPI002024B243